MFESVLLRLCKRPGGIGGVIFKNRSLLQNLTCLQNIANSPCRTAIIVKRRYPVCLYKEQNRPRLQKKTFHYIVEENTDYKPALPIDIVLTTHVTGVGNPGDILTMKPYKAYYNYLLPGLADYVTPETLEYSRKIKENEAIIEQQMSPSVELCKQYLEKRKYSIVMNKETEWTIEPWHVRASFRKAGVHILSDSSIELPKQPIRGPDLELEGKEFTVTITINKRHKVKACCVIHHWSPNIEDKMPFVEKYWLNPAEKVFPEEE